MSIVEFHGGTKFCQGKDGNTENMSRTWKKSRQTPNLKAERLPNLFGTVHRPKHIPANWSFTWNTPKKTTPHINSSQTPGTHPLSDPKKEWALRLVAKHFLVHSLQVFPSLVEAMPPWLLEWSPGDTAVDVSNTLAGANPVLLCKEINPFLRTFSRVPNFEVFKNRTCENFNQKWSSKRVQLTNY